MQHHWTEMQKYKQHLRP